MHLLRSSGNIDNIEIKNTLSDALDIDFGEIKMKTVIINNANNDCVDFSWGNYSIDYALFDRCGDKGVSTGERSNLIIDKIYIKSSYIGIAVKDSSIIRINDGLINSINYCGAAYRKKQEFFEGHLFMNKKICTNKSIFTDKTSFISQKF